MHANIKTSKRKYFTDYDAFVLLTLRAWDMLTFTFRTKETPFILWAIKKNKNFKGRRRSHPTTDSSKITIKLIECYCPYGRKYAHNFLPNIVV